jgi:hypothetical protein
VTFEQAQSKLLEIARRHGGIITAAEVEADETLARERETISAAAHAFAGSTNVFATSREDEDGWFPYAEIRFTDLR